MIPTVESSVIAFPRLEQRSKPSSYTLSEVEQGVKLAAEDIRLNWLKSHATSSKVCARTRLLHAAAVANLSDNAFRVLFLQLSYTNGTVLRTTVDNETIAALARCNEKTIRRSNKELETSGWMTTRRQRRGGAEKVIAIPGDVLALISSEIMENIPPKLVGSGDNQERTKMSTQEVLPVQNGSQDRTEMSTLGSYGKLQERTKMSTQEDSDGPDETDFEVKSGHFCPSRPDKNVRLICNRESVEEKKETLRGAEPVCIQSGREPIDEAQPPQQTPHWGKVPCTAAKVASALTACLAGAIPAAAAPLDPPAIVQPAPEAPDLPECWLTPKAVQNAAMRAAEAKAQRQVAITPDGRLEATGGFLSELQTVFPLVDVTNGLMAAAVSIKPYMTAIETMATIRRQFAYMQTDAKQKADREAKFDKIRKQKSEPDRGQVGPDLFKW